MKIEVWSIGKPNDELYDKAIKEFSKRLNNYTDYKLKIIASKTNTKSSIELQKKEEGLQIFELLKKEDAILICLDEYGKEIDTIKLANQLQQYMNQAIKKIIFLIGGAYGISEDILNIAKAKISLSQLTFPHQLVRLIFTEQLYRAYTIIKGEKYHHT